jgi:hypothetical protein
MPNSPSSSFIPKQGPARRSRQVVSRQVHLFTIFSYVLFFAALAGSVAVFLYSKHLSNQLDSEVEALNGEIGSFSDVKMEQVRSFNMRLQQAADRIGNSVSSVALLEALEDATVQAVNIEKLHLERIADETFVVIAEISTNTFDSSLFQRGVYERSPIVKSVMIEDLGLAKETNEEGESVSSGVSFKAELHIPLKSVPYSPEATISQPVINSDITATTSTASTSESSESNQETL